MQFTILVTDASYKHSIAIQRALRASFPDATLIGHERVSSPLPRWHGKLDRYMCGVPLADVLAAGDFDVVVAVGGESVRTVAAICPRRAVLPPLEQLDRAYDKNEMIELGRSLGLRTPQTSVLHSVDDLARCPSLLPCVVKPAAETEAKGVSYAETIAERDHAVRRWLKLLGPKPHSGVLVQEYVRGDGFALFALYDRGRAVRIFMHRRLREFPVAGGASTAARAVYSRSLRDAGLRLLDALRWHGVAMVEFKRTPATDEFVLMEVNPKFWGSTELALRAGVDFPSDLVRLFRGERLEFIDTFDEHCHFYWPLDDDLVNLWQTRRLRSIRDYWGSNAHTNVGQSIRADAWKCAQTLRRLHATA